MPMAICSLHSLGRGFERSGFREHDTLTADLAVLAVVDLDARQNKVETPSGGHWVGSVQRARRPIAAEKNI